MMILDLTNIVQQLTALTFPDLKEALNLLAGTGAAVAIGWVFGRKGTKELQGATTRVLQETDKLMQESTEVRRLIALTLSGLGNAGLVVLSWDPSGKIVGIGSTKGPTGQSATGQVGVLSPKTTYPISEKQEPDKPG